MSTREPYTPTPEDFKLIFEDNKTGAAIFDFLCRRFVQSAETRGGIDAVLTTYYRLGARAPVDFIATMVNRANGINDEGTTHDITD